MRVVLGARDETIRWLPSTLTPIEGRLLADALRRDILISTEKSHFDQLIAEVKELQAPAQMKTRIGDLVRRVPLALRASKPPVDIYADDSIEGNEPKLLSAITSDRFATLRDTRAGSVIQGDDRDEIFSRFLMPYAAAASGVWCLDQYVLTNLNDGRADGLLWFIQSCIQLGVNTFAIFGVMPDSGNVDRCSSILRSRLTRPISMRQQGIRVTIKLVAADHRLGPKSQGGDGSLVHDRHLRFRIGNDAQRITPLFDLGPGMNVFNSQSVSESFYLNESPDAGAAKSREKTMALKAAQPFPEIELA